VTSDGREIPHAAPGDLPNASEQIRCAIPIDDSAHPFGPIPKSEGLRQSSTGSFTPAMLNAESVSATIAGRCRNRIAEWRRTPRRARRLGLRGWPISYCDRREWRHRSGSYGNPKKGPTTNTTPTLEYDQEANALYPRFSFAEIDDTIPLSDSVCVDIDAEGDPVGVEVLHATAGELPNIDLLGKAVALCELLELRAA
jgi:uncharacterized protein YuzE